MSNQDELIRKSIKCIELCVVGKQSNEDLLSFHADFATPAAWTFCTYSEHIDFLKEINNLHNFHNQNKIINGEVLEQWRLANDLIILGGTSQLYEESVVKNIKDNASKIACFILFPILEEVARQVSEYWNEEGIILEDTPEASIKNGRYKKGDRINSLNDKLQLMEYTLPRSIKEFLRKLSSVMQQQPIDGMIIEIPHFYKQLQLERNSMLHGRKYRSNIALLISLIISFLYLGVEKGNSINS